jgi:hypothetical protein
MKLLKHRGKTLKNTNHKIRNSHIMGGSINHLLNNSNLGGNVSELKKQLRHLVIKPKKTKKITF